MRLTNALNLPQPLVSAVANDPYDAGNSDISVTRLIAPPRKVELERRHADEITEDAADRLWSLMGQSIHTILERANESGIVEERLFMDVDGWVLSGQFDRMALVPGGGFNAVLQDYKMASVWELIHGVKGERVDQLNCLAHLARQYNYPVEALQIVFIFRDWQMSRAKREPDYPQRQVAVVDIPLWAPEKADRYIRERVTMHKAARETLPECTDEERWKDPAKWAVMKKGRESALRVLDSFEAARAWCEEKGHAEYRSPDPDNPDNPDPPEWIFAKEIDLEHRPSEPRRCADYCAASQFCEQYQNEKAAS